MFRLTSGTARLLLTAATLLPCPAAAQNVTGTISGTVVDDQKQLVPGATVTVINEANNDTRSVTTGPSGDFQVTNLLPGSYTVRVEMANFRTVERTRNVLSAAERLSVGTLTLAVGPLGETVTVEASGTQVNVAETQHSGLITSRQIEQIQVKARDVTSLMRLLPGVRYEDNVEALGDSFGTLVPHVGGQRRDWNTIMVDGVLGNEIGQANRMAQQINLDAIGRDQGPAQHVSRRVRPHRRRAGPDHQQERQFTVRGQPLLLRPPREAECQQLLQQPPEPR
jgi:hypothetical protein